MKGIVVWYLSGFYKKPKVSNTRQSPWVETVDWTGNGPRSQLDSGTFALHGPMGKFLYFIGVFSDIESQSWKFCLFCGSGREEALQSDSRWSLSMCLGPWRWTPVTDVLHRRAGERRNRIHFQFFSIQFIVINCEFLFSWRSLIILP